MEKVILDTNFLMIPYQFKVDIFSELDRIGPFKLFVLDKTVKELEKLAEHEKGKNKLAARLALTFIKAKALNIITALQDEYADEALVRLSKEGYTIATQDIELQKKIKKKIILRQKKYLELRE